MPAAAAPAWPLKIGPTKRYLVDQNERPVLVHGESPWSLIVGPPPQEVELYLANRKAKGFNSIIVNIIEHLFHSRAPKNYRGDAPFTTPGDFSTPNDKYFAHADWVIRKAGEYGMQVLLSPAFVGCRGTEHGWGKEMVASGPRKCEWYGRYLGERYRGCDNVFWHMACDQNPTVEMETVQAMARGIKAADERHLMTALVQPESSPRDIFSEPDWLDVNGVYSYKLVHDLLRADYERQPVKPFVLIESTYEGEHNASEVQIRRQAYWAILCGACGQFVGVYPLWQFAEGWQQSMEGMASVSMSHLRKLFESRRWWELAPTKNRSVVVKGLGECHGLDYLAAAVTGDGSTLIAYVPSPRRLVIDTTKLKGSSFRGWWFNPRNGEAESAGEIPGGGLAPLNPPPGEAPGKDDWVLVMDDADKRLGPPGRQAEL